MNFLRTRSALVLLTLLAFGAPLCGQSAKVVVSSNATVYVKPTAARITFSLTAQSQGQPQARATNDEQVAQMKKAVADLSLPSVQLKVVPVAINTVVVTEGQRLVAGAGFIPPQPPLETKQAQTLFVVTVRDKDVDGLHEKVRKLADAAVSNGAFAPDDTNSQRPRPLALGTTTETLHGPKIEWLVDDASTAREQAVKRAVKEVTETARAAVVDTAKLQVVEIVITTQEESPTVRPFRPDLPVLQPGSVAITVQVKVTFAY
jgi:uncharacterized protein YggE